jgi:hypothetical protein
MTTAMAGVYTLTASNTCGAATAVNTASVVVNTINTAGAASTTPTLCISTVLTNITHATTGATGIGAATGLPAGVTAAFSSNTITISGTPSASGTFSYSIPLTGGCGTVNATGTITVTANASIISVTGTTPLCITGTATYTANTVVLSGGTGSWSSSNAAVATVSVAGLVTGVTAGSCNIIYTITGGCGGIKTAQQAVTISPNASIASVTGSVPAGVLCTETYTANTVVLSGGTGSWSSSNATVASVTAAGLVKGESIGICNIIYTITGGCGGIKTAQKYTKIVNYMCE